MDKLIEIIGWKRKEIESQIRPIKDDELIRFSMSNKVGSTFHQALAVPERLSVIAEIKRSSPSAGEFAIDIDAAEQARKYYNGGVDAISVLTDEKFFSGQLSDLWQVTDFLGSRDDPTPCLRKDFMVHPIQVLEAAEAGARAILIIVRALENDEIKVLFDSAKIAGLECLFEIHNEGDLERAINLGAMIIGVNNRDLTEFITDLKVSEKLIPQLPDEVVAISESGIFSADDAARVREAGADAVLIGEALMKAEEPEHLIAEIQNI